MESNPLLKKIEEELSFWMEEFRKIGVEQIENAKYLIRLFIKYYPNYKKFFQDTIEDIQQKNPPNKFSFMIDTLIKKMERSRSRRRV
jgi:hypothetical protein